MIPLILDRFSIKLPPLQSNKRSAPEASTLPYASPSQLSVHSLRVGGVLLGC